MEKTIKYLENGEYHYATVKDVGDLAKLKTDSKDDLVTAINELFVTGGDAPKKPEGYDKLVDNVADAIKKQQQMTDTITNMQQSAQLSDAEMEHMKQVQEELQEIFQRLEKQENVNLNFLYKALPLTGDSAQMYSKVIQTMQNIDLWQYLNDPSDSDTCSIGGSHMLNLYGRPLDAEDVFNNSEATCESLGFKIRYDE